MEHKDDLAAALRERQPSPSSDRSYKHQSLTPTNGRSGSPEALEKVLHYFKRVNRLLYTGNVSVEIGFNLRQTEEMLGKLEVAGNIRKLEPRELRIKGMNDKDEVWELVPKKVV